jgi:hypothetical protein
MTSKTLQTIPLKTLAGLVIAGRAGFADFFSRCAALEIRPDTAARLLDTERERGERLPDEGWRPVALPAFTDDYQVSSLGRIRRVTHCRRSKAVRLLHGEILRKGYIRVTLVNSVARDKVLLHKLVATAFLGPIPSGKEINHKDGNKANNTVANLEYVTQAENIRHRDEAGLHRILRGEKHGSARLTAAQVRAIRAAAAAGATVTELANAYQISKPHVACLVKRKLWRSLI